MAQTANIGRFVGRREQLSLLRRSYEHALAGDGRIVFVAGEAGAGKSRLVFEFCEGLGQLNVRCVAGQCLEYAQSPLAPFISILEALVADDSNVLKPKTALRRTLARLIPQLLDEAPVSADAETDKLRQLSAIAEALTLFSTVQPIAIVLEDLQWADRATLELLQYLAPNLASSRLLIVATFRTEDIKRRHPLRSVLAKMERQRAVERVEATPLSDAEMHELLFWALGDGSRLRPATMTAICAQAEGNPLFAEEMLRTVVDSGDADHVQRLPASLREAVLDRYATLDDVARSVVSHAAVIGRRFKLDFLANIATRSIDETISALKASIELSLIVEASNGETYFTFKHELTRQAVYGELLTTEARLLHRKIATVLEAADKEAHATELAYHWWQAREPQRAAHYHELAGDAAFEVFAYRDALAGFERALDWGEPDGANRAALQLKLADALHQCGLAERAQRATEAALEYYEKAGDPENAATTCLKLAWLCGGYGDSVGALRHTERALTLIGNDPGSPAYFTAHVEMMRLNMQARWDPRKQLVHMELAEKATGPRPVAAQISLLAMRSAMLAGMGKSSDALARTREAAALALDNGDARAAIQSWATFAYDMTEAGETALSLQGFERALEIIETRNIGGLTAAWVRGTFAHAKLVSGDLQGARDLVAQGLAAGIENPVFRMVFARTGITLGLQMADEDLIKRCADKHLLDFAWRSSEAWTVGMTAPFAENYYIHGKEAEASALLHNALGVLERIAAQPSYGENDAMCLAVARFGDIADIPAARKFLNAAATTSDVRSTQANERLFEAYAAARTGDAATAVEKAREAAARYREIGWPHFEAQALEIAGKPAEALDKYKRIGALRDSRRLDAALNPVNKRGRAKGELTAREREICDLLAQGKTNKAIAEQLVLSERTVETHVSSVLTKMGAASRAELIAKLKV